MWQYYSLAFLVGACTMTIELVAGRLVAPALGVSLYTWTSIIGVVLAGMSAGSFVGGAMSDKHDPKRLLGPVLFAAGAITLLILPALPLMWFVGPMAKTPVLRVVVPSFVLFGIPAFFLGLVSPIIYRICLNDPLRTGSTVGRLSASGSLGSIFGTFVTGFWLIPSFGTRAIVMGVSGGLLLLAAIFHLWRGKKEQVTALLTIIVLMGGLFRPAVRLFSGDFVTESAYFAIRITQETDPAGGSFKKLVLDNLVHSGANPERPDDLWYEYEKITAWVIANAMPVDADTLFVGGGGYTLPYWVERHYPKTRIDVAEIDPEVTKVAMREFIPDSKRINSINEDGRMVLRQMAATKKYDMVFSDAFNDVSVPYHLTTLEFNRDVKAHMTARGFYMVNIVDNPKGQFIGAFANTLSQVFKNVVILPGSATAAIMGEGRTPLVVVASDYRIPFEEWRAPDEVYFLIAPRQPDPKNLVLTDDYAPVDNLLLPVFAAKLMR